MKKIKLRQLALYTCAIGFLFCANAFAQTLDTSKSESDIEEKTASINELVDREQTSIPSIPLDVNRRVKKWLQYFSDVDKARFQRFIDRGHRYRSLVENILVSNGLPRELYNLALIESGYRRRARSTAAAVGVWQFIPATARRYGLVVSHDLDERHDPVRATEAASKYLADLYNIFGSWHLAMAAYNAGEYRILSAVVRGKSRNFWELADQSVLPRETADYVPKFVAATLIGNNLIDFGFSQPSGKSFPEVKPIAVPTNYTLKNLTSLFGLSLKEFTDLNPQLKTHRLPSRFKNVELWVPSSIAESKNWKNILTLQRRSKKSSPNRIRYRVRRGDNLSSIAKQFGVSVNHILSKNNGVKKSIQIGQFLQIVSPKL